MTNLPVIKNNNYGDMENKQCKQAALDEFKSWVDETKEGLLKSLPITDRKVMKENNIASIGGVLPDNKDVWLTATQLDYETTLYSYMLDKFIAYRKDRQAGKLSYLPKIHIYTDAELHVNHFADITTKISLHDMLDCDLVIIYTGTLNTKISLSPAIIMDMVDGCKINHKHFWIVDQPGNTLDMASHILHSMKLNTVLQNETKHYNLTTKVAHPTLTAVVVAPQPQPKSKGGSINDLVL